MDSNDSDARRLFDDLRVRAPIGGRLDLAAILAAADELGIGLTPGVWEAVEARIFPEQLLSRSVTDFIVTIAKAQKPRRILNLWSGDGMLSLRLQETLPSVQLTGIEPNSQAVQFAEHFSSGCEQWILARPREAIGDERLGAEPYDLVVSAGPFGMRSETFRTELGDGSPLAITDEAARIDLIQYAPLVGLSGTALLLTTNSILWSTKSKKLLDALRGVGLWLYAAISLPAGTLTHATTIPAVVAMFSRTPTEDVYLAELPRTVEAQRRLLENIASGRTAKSPEGGILLPFDQLAPLETIIARGEVRRGLTATGVTTGTLGEIALDMNRPADRDGRLAFEDCENSFYMPLVGFGPARAAVPEKISKEWVQVVLDPKQAFAEHVARWLSSPLGRRSREAEATGVSIPRISFGALSSLRVPVPPIAEQNQALLLDTRLVALSAEVQQMRDDLWARPRRLGAIARRVGKLAPVDDVATWIETLPLPLATVGRAYYARQDTRTRIEAIFHFFEAMAEFHAAVLLSGLASDPAYFNNVREDLLGSADQRQRYFEKASIGNWTAMASRLSKEIRRLRDQFDSDEHIGRDAVMRWFGRPTPEWLDMMTSAALYDTLDAARRRRNDWKGHGGVSGDSSNDQRLLDLEDLLRAVRSVAGDSWDSATLVSPGPMSLTNGTLETTVDVLVGSGMPFKQERIVTTDPLDRAFLHIVHGQGGASMQLLPLVRMMPSPTSANVACYFYNRVEGGELRYVSYYYEDAPEAMVSGSDAPAVAVLQALGLADG